MRWKQLIYGVAISPPPAPLNLYRHATNVVIVVILIAAAIAAAFTHYRQTLLAVGDDAAVYLSRTLFPILLLLPIVQRVKMGPLSGDQTA